MFLWLSFAFRFSTVAFRCRPSTAKSVWQQAQSRYCHQPRNPLELPVLIMCPQYCSQTLEAEKTKIFRIRTIEKIFFLLYPIIDIPGSHH